jgi:hypothetical protein
MRSISSMYSLGSISFADPAIRSLYHSYCDMRSSPQSKHAGRPVAAADSENTQPNAPVRPSTATLAAAERAGYWAEAVDLAGWTMTARVMETLLDEAAMQTGR